ncbi:MAG TPA: EAL domain-containing protein [Actinomycetota bacterium]
MKEGALGRGEGSGRRGGHHRLSTGHGARQVWYLTAFLAVAAAVLYVGPVRALSPADTPIDLPWWSIAVGFVLAEIFVVHIQVRRDAHSFSMSELPLVMGLFFVSPAGLIAGQLAGATVALVLHRRQTLQKLLFNLSHFALETSLAILIFRSVAALGAEVQPRDWGAAFLATGIATALALNAIFIAVSLSQGRSDVEALPRTLLLGGTTTMANTSLALLGATVVWRDPTAIWLLLIPAATLFIAYRTTMAMQDRQQSIEALYESTRITAAHEQNSEVGSLLEQLRAMYRAEIAEIVFLPPALGDPILRATLGPGDRFEGLRADVRPSGVFAHVIAEQRGVILPRSQGQERLSHRFPDIALKDGMIVPLIGESRVLGTLAVVNHLGDVSSFEGDDLRLFETLANHVSVALENGRLEKSLAKVNELQESLRHQAFHDPLTGLANRALFGERAQHALLQAARDMTTTAVLFIDLDDFKDVNDSLGHAAGDRLLATMAGRLTSTMRPGDTVARLGGDEFAILLERTTDREARSVAERVIELLQRSVALQRTEVQVRASVGIALEQGAGDAESLMRNADAAMYRAKQLGKNRCVVFETSMHADALLHLQLANDARLALERSEFRLVYQPIVSLSTGRITGVETLLRWDHPTRGTLEPGEFISMAEESGLIHPIGRWVLVEACAQARAWSEAFPKPAPPTISVNLSSRQVMQPDLVGDVERILDSLAVDPSTLILEITETVVLKDEERTISKLRALKNLGVRIALDDFGTGYSSLGYLQRLPIDVLKIDPSFVEGVGGAPEDEAVARAIIKLANTFRIDVVAEGVERSEQIARLRDLGCTHAQGFRLGRPTGADAITRLLESRVGLRADVDPGERPPTAHAPRPSRGRRAG